MDKILLKMIERTLVLIKPDGVQRKLIGDIIKRFEDNGLEVTSMKMITADTEIVEKHYPAEEDYLVSLGKKSEAAGDKIDNYKEQGMMIVNGLRDYLTGNAIVAMVIEGLHAIEVVRKIVGGTAPKDAAVGTIRGDFAHVSFEEIPFEKVSFVKGSSFKVSIESFSFEGMPRLLRRFM